MGVKSRPQGRGEVAVKKARGGGSTTGVNEDCGGRWGRRCGEEFQLRVRLVLNAGPEPSRRRLRVRKSGVGPARDVHDPVLVLGEQVKPSRQGVADVTLLL